MRSTLSRSLIVQKHWPVLTPLLPDPSAPAVALDRAVCVVGSRSLVHLPLFAKTVSRAHALIVNDRHDNAGEVYIRDLASCNGLYVNGAAVREVVLHDGDQLRIGPFAYRCTSGFGGDGGAEPLDELIEENTFTPGSPQMELHVAGAWLRDGRLSVSDRTAVIGLREDCDVILPGPNVDPAHAVVFRRGGKWYIRDLDSRGGTFLNGARVRENTLSPGDTIRVGTAEIRYVLAMTTGPSADASHGGMVSPWESIELDNVESAEEAQSILPTPAPEPGMTGAGRRAGAPLATMLSSSGRSRAVALASAGPVEEEPTGARESAAAAEEPPATSHVEMAQSEGFVVDSPHAEPPADLADEASIPLAPAPPAAEQRNGDGESIPLDLVDAPGLSAFAIHAADPGVGNGDQPRATEEEPDYSIPIKSATEFPLTEAAGALAKELAALEQVVSDASLDEPRETPEEAIADLPVAEGAAERVPSASNGEHDIPHDLPPAIANDEPPVTSDEPSAVSEVSPPAPVRRINRLVGRLYRDVSALDSAWRTIKESRPEWTGDDPDRQPDSHHNGHEHHEQTPPSQP